MRTEDQDLTPIDKQSNRGFYIGWINIALILFTAFLIYHVGKGGDGVVEIIVLIAIELILSIIGLVLSLKDVPKDRKHGGVALFLNGLVVLLFLGIIGKFITGF